MTLPLNVGVSAAWAGGADDVWFTGRDQTNSNTGNSVAMHWDGAALSQDVGGVIGQGLGPLSATKTSFYAAAENGIVRRAR